jgi:predicted transcriptional regulator
VQIVRNRGVFVRKISLEEALHLYDVRSGLARVAGRLLAGRVTVKQIAVLNSLYEDLERAREAQDQAAYNEGNRQFHASLLDFTGNRRLISYHETTEKELRQFVRRGVLGAARLRISNREHKHILDCIAAGDDEGAAAASNATSSTASNGCWKACPPAASRIRPRPAAKTIREKTTNDDHRERYQEEAASRQLAVALGGSLADGQHRRDCQGMRVRLAVHRHGTQPMDVDAAVQISVAALPTASPPSSAYRPTSISTPPACSMAAPKASSFPMSIRSNRPPSGRELQVPADRPSLADRPDAAAGLPGNAGCRG